MTEMKYWRLRMKGEISAQQARQLYLKMRCTSFASIIRRERLTSITPQPCTPPRLIWPLGKPKAPKKFPWMT